MSERVAVHNALFGQKEAARKRKLKANYKTKENVHVPSDSEEVNNPGQKKRLSHLVFGNIVSGTERLE